MTLTILITGVNIKYNNFQLVNLPLSRSVAGAQKKTFMVGSFTRCAPDRVTNGVITPISRVRNVITPVTHFIFWPFIGAIIGVLTLLITGFWAHLVYTPAMVFKFCGQSLAFWQMAQVFFWCVENDARCPLYATPLTLKKFEDPIFSYKVHCNIYIYICMNL